MQQGELSTRRDRDAVQLSVMDGSSGATRTLANLLAKHNSNYREGIIHVTQLLCRTLGGTLLECSGHGRYSVIFGLST